MKYKNSLCVKIEKLNIVILSQSQVHIAQVLAELKEYIPLRNMLILFLKLCRPLDNVTLK